MSLPAKIFTVLLTTALVATLAYGGREVRAPSVSAESVLVASTGTSKDALGQDPGRSSELAQSYVSLIPRDTQVLRDVARGAGIGRERATRALRVRRSSGGSVLTVELTASSPGRARRALRTMLASLRDPRSNASAIDADTLRVLSIARTARVVSGDSYRARATVLVTAPAGISGEGTILAANRLAQNYSALIPDDDQAIAAAERRSGVRVRGKVKVTNDPNTSVLRVSVRASDYENARRGLLALVGVITGPSPVSTLIVPSTLDVVRGPAGSAPKSSPISTLVVGAVLGLLLGLLFVAVLSRRGKRIGNVADASVELGRPVSDLRVLDDDFAQLILDRWSGIVGASRSIVLVSTASELDQLTAELAETFARVEAAHDGDHGLGAAFQARPYSYATRPFVEPLDIQPMVVLVCRQRQPLGPLAEFNARIEGAGGDLRWVLVAPSQQLELLVEDLQRVGRSSGTPQSTAPDAV